MARLTHDSRRHRHRRSLRRLLPLWLIVGLVGLGLALAAYQQQRRSAIEVAEVPRDAAEDRTAEAGADPAPSPEDPTADREAGESAEANTDVATTTDLPPDQQVARPEDVGPPEVDSGAGAEPETAGEAGRLATLDQQDRDRSRDSSELRTGPSAARPESEELSVSREPAESLGGSPSGVSDPPARPPESEAGDALPSAGERPGPAPAEPKVATPTAGPPPQAGSLQQEQAAEAPQAGPEPGSESLVAETIRRALAALLENRPDDPVQQPDAPGQKPAEPEQPAPPDKLAGQSPTAPQLAAVEPTDEAMPKAIAPSFDVVHVQRGGRAVVAGRAAPGAEVELRVGGELIDRVRADQRGQWVSVPQRTLPAGDQELTVAARSGDALPIQSEQVVVLAVPGTEPTSGQSDHPAAAAVTLEAPDDEALAVLLPKDGQGQGRVLQAPGRISSDGQLALLMLDYDETGEIRLSGEAAPGSAVRVYVDNKLAGEAVAGEDGTWTCALDRTLAPGTYTLRVDQLDRNGQTVARLETPFTRVAQPPVQGDVLVDYVVVQPGNSLWRIARRLFGSGFRYVHIYEANQAQIRDPDLIYPGQVFEIPVGMGSAG